MEQFGRNLTAGLLNAGLNLEDITKRLDDLHRGIRYELSLSSSPSQTLKKDTKTQMTDKELVEHVTKALYEVS
jgi:hypothetical protein